MRQDILQEAIDIIKGHALMLKLCQKRKFNILDYLEEEQSEQTNNKHHNISPF